MAEYRMDIELWTKEGSGVLLHPPLLLNACKANVFGIRYEYPGGSVSQALFTYLSGKPDRDFFDRHPELFFENHLVCMTPAWESFLRESAPVDTVMMRQMMKPKYGSSAKALAPLPDGYELVPFDEAVFAHHPFGHGIHYVDFDDFSLNGSGAAVRCGKEIVASASSFLTFENGVELDVSTAPEHRRKGLADHCVSFMMADCAARGITVHWDAQNIPSAAMAFSHGFEPEQEYAVYILK